MIFFLNEQKRKNVTWDGWKTKLLLVTCTNMEASRQPSVNTQQVGNVYICPTLINKTFDEILKGPIIGKPPKGFM